jgi:predicted RNase H-like HicB family nuclease
MSLASDYSDAIAALDSLLAEVVAAEDGITNPSQADGTSTQKATLAEARLNIKAALDVMHDGYRVKVAGDGDPRDRTLTILTTFGV